LISPASCPFSRPRQTIDRLSCVPLVRRVTCLGTVVACEIVASAGDGSYSSTDTVDLVRLLRARGLHVRPIGNVVYLMVSAATMPRDIHLYLSALLDALTDWSATKLAGHPPVPATSTDAIDRQTII
jgi:adenosylmethionine-8-amino-7-oxononanoate aminotransferase